MLCSSVLSLQCSPKHPGGDFGDSTCLCRVLTEMRMFVPQRDGLRLLSLQPFKKQSKTAPWPESCHCVSALLKTAQQVTDTALYLVYSADLLRDLSDVHVGLDF